MKWIGTRIGMLETATTLPGKVTGSDAPRFSMNSPKRRWAASCGTPKSSQRRRWSLSVGSRHGFTTTNRTNPGRLLAARHNAALRSSVESGALRSVQANRIGRDCRVTLVDERLSVNEGEGAQGCHGLVEAVPGERRAEGLTEFLPRFDE